MSRVRMKCTNVESEVNFFIEINLHPKLNFVIEIGVIVFIESRLALRWMRIAAANELNATVQ